MGNQFSPARIEERFHTVAGLADRRIILVECDAIDKHQLQIGTKVVPCLVSNGTIHQNLKNNISSEEFSIKLIYLHIVVEFLSDGAQIHRRSDDFFISRKLFGVDG